MGIKHKVDSIRDLNLQNKGIVPPQDWNDVEQVRAVKKQEVGIACSKTIYAGINIDGKQYSLEEHDQTELIAQMQSVQMGAEAVPYHANGELCRMIPAEEFITIATAASEHIFYHRSYVNHLGAWIARAEGQELTGITYGADLPDDLKESMGAILAAAKGEPT